MNAPSIETINASIQKPFTKFLVWLSNIHDWIMSTEKRRKWASRIIVLTLVAEAELHYKGFTHWSDGKHWWDYVPIFGVIADYFLK